MKATCFFVGWLFCAHKRAGGVKLHGILWPAGRKRGGCYG